ncbi:MAG TPA: hypothetical protein VGF84_00735 [Micromonosporaceae bacterium]
MPDPLSAILATDDPYAAARAFVAAGWTLEFETPPDSDDRLAAVSLDGAQLMLGIAEEKFLAAASRDYRGAGVVFHIPVDDIQSVYERHRDAGVAVDQPVARPWGEIAFHGDIAGYRFMVTAADGR